MKLLMLLGKDFAGNVVLLLLGAAITGFAGPYLFKRIDAQKFKEQKIYEEKLARQSKVIEAQEQLIDNLADILWQFQMDMIEVSYYEDLNKGMYKAAVNNYERTAGRSLSRIRAVISKSIRLIPRPMYDKLNSLYYRELLRLDNCLEHLIKTHPPRGWAELNVYLVNILPQHVDNLLDELSSELKLKAGPTIESRFDAEKIARDGLRNVMENACPDIALPF